MTIYDAAMLAVVVAGMVWGAMRGITWQVAGIASLVLGYAVAFPLSGELAPQFPGEPIVARALAMLACYLATSGGVYLVAWLIRATLRKLKFEAYDRHLGMILGGAEGALLGIVVTVFVVCLAPSSRDPILTSPSGRVVNQLLDAVQPALPGELRTVLAPFWNHEAGEPVERLAELDDPKTIPDNARSALEWFQERLPEPRTVTTKTRTDSAAAPDSDRFGVTGALDSSVVRSVLREGAKQVLEERPRRGGADPKSRAASAPSTYWWEEASHGRNP